MKQKNSFSGQIGFVFAAAGSAVGVGNLWRFPYLAAKDGGGLVPDHLSGTGVDGRICVTDYGYSNWPQDRQKCNLCL